MSAMMIIKPKDEAMRESYSAEQRFVKKVEYPEEGGILTWFNNERYPEKQLVYPEMFAVLNPVKRSFLFLPKLLKQSHLAKVLLVLSFILPGCRKIKRVLRELYTDLFWSGLHLVALKPDFYCTSAREIRRTGLLFIKDERIVDMICLFWEYDNAYRYRGQDFAGILDKEAFLDNPAKEFKRAFTEYCKRDLILEDKKQLTKFIAPILLFLYKKEIRAFIKELDLEKVKLDIADKYWCYHRTDYNADGLDLIDRMRKRSLMQLSK